MFSWDTGKARRNWKKHGVSFEEACTIFADSAALELEDIEHGQMERRWIRVGMSLQARILVVAYSMRRMKDGTEEIKLISARQASGRERKAYAG